MKAWAGLFVLGVGCGFLGGCQQSLPAPPPHDLAAFVPNYAASIPSLSNWTSFPIRVAFSRGGSYSAQLETWAREGFDKWVVGTNGVISYVVVGPEEPHHLTVSFEGVAFLPNDPPAAGFAQTNFYNGWISSATIRLATLHQTAVKFRGLAAHELGHALGLVDGHSPDPNDIMHPVDTTNASVERQLSQADINTMKTCYTRLFL